MITSVMLARQIILPLPCPNRLTPLLRYSCRLFVAPQNVNSFGINQIQTLSAKYRGWGIGIPNATAGHPGWGYLAHLLRHCTTIPHRFATSLFSCSYELLFSQLLSFHKHLRCPIVFFFAWQNRPAFPNQEFSALLRVLCDSALSFSFASSEPFKPFNFQLSTVNRPSRQLECL